MQHVALHASCIVRGKLIGVVRHRATRWAETDLNENEKKKGSLFDLTEVRLYAIISRLIIPIWMRFSTCICQTLGEGFG